MNVKRTLGGLWRRGEEEEEEEEEEKRKAGGFISLPQCNRKNDGREDQSPLSI